MDPTQPQPNPRVARWGQERRLEFIDFRLSWEGRINRADLINFFGISVPQASLDLARYIELAPDNVQYDKKAKVYLATPTFIPALTSADAYGYLNELFGINASLLRMESTFIGWHPPTAIAPHPPRLVPANVLKAVLRAIRQHSTLAIHYQSMSQDTPSERVISPHALAFDGFRWHVRAYCYKRSAFLDFVLARLTAIEVSTQIAVDPSLDVAWHTIVELKIAPNPDLPPAQRRIIELDYGMTDGVISMPTRAALLFYALEHLGLQAKTRPAAQPIVLLNQIDIEKLIHRD